MSDRAKPIGQMTLEEKIAELDRVEEQPDDTSIDTDTDTDTDPVHVMQELLLKHEDTQINRVEDPDLVRVLNELRNVAFANIADLFEHKSVINYIGLDENDKEVYEEVQRLSVRDITSLPREVSACIQQVKVTSTAKGDVVEVKMYDKLVSLDRLMRFHGAYARDNDQQAKPANGVMDLLLTSIGAQGLPSIEANDA